MDKTLFEDDVKRYVYITTTNYAHNGHYDVSLLDHDGLLENGLDPDGTNFPLYNNNDDETKLKKLCDLWVGEIVCGFGNGTFIIRVA